MLTSAFALAAPSPELASLLAQRQCESPKRPVPCWGDEGRTPWEVPSAPLPDPRFTVLAEPQGATWVLSAGTTSWTFSLGATAEPPAPWVEKAGERWVVPAVRPSTDGIVVVDDRTLLCVFLLRDASAPHELAVRVTPGLSGLRLATNVPVLDTKHEARAAMTTWDGESARLAFDPSSMTYPLLATLRFDLDVPLAAAPPGALEWRNARLEGPGTRAGHSMAYDVARKRVVLSGGRHLDDRVWALDANGWQGLRSIGSPWHRRGQTAAYDPVRQRVLFFGGADHQGHATRDTWHWDGTNLERALPTESPPARTWAAMATDTARKRIVLVGGTGSEGDPEACRYDCDGTWEWDGTTWTKKTPPTAPSARWGHAMAFDAARRVVVLFGGGSYGQGCTTAGCDDTWEWDGAVWMKKTPRASPSRRTFAAMAYDSGRRRVVLFGGSSESCTDKVCGDTWEWDGTSWARLSPAVSPTPRAHHALAYDEGRRRVVLYGGDAQGDHETWELDGTSWTPRWVAPSPFHGAQMAYDAANRQVLLFGGELLDDRDDGEAWLWDGASWGVKKPALRPTPRRYHAMATDRARKQIVLFGGDSATCGTGTSPASCGDTWLWNGATWSRPTLAVAPPARYLHGMAYDDARGRVVLHGGASTNSAPLLDTWEWDGVTWTRIPQHGAVPREGMMAYDASRKRVVLHDGSTTWEWDGTTWESRNAGFSRHGATLVESRTLKRVLLISGESESCPKRHCDDVWAWEGSAWTRLETSTTTPGPRWRTAAAWDDARGEVVLYGGLRSMQGSPGDTWTLR